MITKGNGNGAKLKRTYSATSNNGNNNITTETII